MVYRCYEIKTGSGASVNKEPAQELHKSVIKNFKRKKVYARFRDNIWAADLAEMGWLSSKINLLNIYIWQMLSANLLRLNFRQIKKVGFIKIVNESNHKPNKLSVINEKNFMIALCKNGYLIMIL